MLRLAIIVLVIVVALLRGGSLRNFAAVQLRWLPLVIVGFALQLLIFTPFARVAAGGLRDPADLCAVAGAAGDLGGGQLAHPRHGADRDRAGAECDRDRREWRAYAGFAGGRAAGTASTKRWQPTIRAHPSTCLWRVIRCDFGCSPISSSSHSGCRSRRVMSIGDLLLTIGIAILCYRTILPRAGAGRACASAGRWIGGKREWTGRDFRRKSLQ